MVAMTTEPGNAHPLDLCLGTHAFLHRQHIYTPTSDINGSFPAKVGVDFQFCGNGDIIRRRTKQKF